MKIFYNGYPSIFLTYTYFEYLSTFKIKLLVHVFEYLEQVLVPNTESVFCLTINQQLNYKKFNFTKTVLWCMLLGVCSVGTF